ncbi:hypothetical protein DAETH_47920 (plasmid) [Deinococcus aetherius]|uniref:Polymerase nucleotidyl transferase domain-containing protein n=1 Tax=Deinococcus aetherius TaxID=200252 RepID=A0ABM8ALV9_9DEIO|nr:hypothetical protein [Deinococcus aetherius]BDP44823.1 hypothetical protein DAETH_47920 [Deinococcus aetherius]
MPEHPATQKAQLRAALAVDRTLTTAQLERRGLARAAEWLALPTVTRTCRTRTTQPHSDIDLVFVALDDSVLTRPSRDLMHDAGLAEARHRLQRGMVPSARWRHVELAGRQRVHLPDAEVLHHDPRKDWAVEFDAGYSPERREAKLEAAARVGYGVLVWATSIHARIPVVTAQAAALHSRERLSGVEGVVAVFVDFWSSRDPYADRPRCHKDMTKSVWFRERAGG